MCHPRVSVGSATLASFTTASASAWSEPANSSPPNLRPPVRRPAFPLPRGPALRPWYVPIAENRLLWWRFASAPAPRPKGRWPDVVSSEAILPLAAAGVCLKMPIFPVSPPIFRLSATQNRQTRLPVPVSGLSRPRIRHESACPHRLALLQNP